DHHPRERKLRVAAAVAEVASATGAAPAQVCIAWLLSRRDRVNLVPILGARTAVQLEEKLGGLELRLPQESLARLEEASAIPLGFPSTFLADDEVVELIFGRTRPLIDA